MSAAGPSIPKVYSPDGVTCLLSNSFDSARAQGAAAASISTLQRHRKPSLNVIAVRIGAFAIEIEIGRPGEAAESGLSYGLPLCHHDDLAGRNHAAFLAGEIAGSCSTAARAAAATVKFPECR